MRVTGDKSKVVGSYACTSTNDEKYLHECLTYGIYYEGSCRERGPAYVKCYDGNVYIITIHFLRFINNTLT